MDVAGTEAPVTELRHALVLLGALQRQLYGELRPSAEAAADATLEAISRRLWKALLALEDNTPERAAVMLDRLRTAGGA